MAYSIKRNRAMLERLRKSSEFKQAFAHGQKLVDRRFVLLATKHDDTARFGLVISKKVGNAVVRNRIRRRIREYFRLHAEAMPPYNIVIIARHQASQAVTHEIWAELENLLQRLRRRKALAH